MQNNKHSYMMLSRLQQDCEYYLGFGNFCDKHLYYGNVQEHIDQMILLYDSLKIKPEWLKKEQINKYCFNMINKIRINF